MVIYWHVLIAKHKQADSAADMLSGRYSVLRQSTTDPGWVSVLQLLPAWMTTVLLAVLLSFLSFKLISRGLKTYQTETRELAADVSNEHPGTSGGDGGGAPAVTGGSPRILGEAPIAHWVMAVQV